MSDTAKHGVFSLEQARLYPVVYITGALATALTLARWAGLDVSFLLPSQDISSGQVWRLVTAAFIHGDVTHLFFNLYWLRIFGRAVEGAFGHAKTAGLLLLFALGANGVQFAISAGGIGLSGVGYGLFGMLWILSPRDPRFQGVITRNLALLFIFWLVLCYWLTLANVYPIGNAAHIAGLVLGVFTGSALVWPRWRIVAWAGFAAVFIFGLWGATSGRIYLNGYEQANRGYEALKNHRSEEALYWFKKASILEPRAASIWYDMGVAYEWEGMMSEAHNAFARAWALAPENTHYKEAEKRSRQ